MKATGIVRAIDALGRFVIPMEIRRTLQIKEGDLLELYTTDDGLVLRPYRERCICCGAEKALAHVAGIALCPACIQTFQCEAAQTDD